MDSTPESPEIETGWLGELTPEQIEWLETTIGYQHWGRPAFSVAYDDRYKRCLIPGTSIGSLARLLRRANHGLWFDRLDGSITVTPLYVLANAGLIQQRHFARQRLAQSRRATQKAQEVWATVRDIKTMYLDINLIEAAVAVANAWPEVIGCVLGPAIVRTSFGGFGVEAGQIAVQFWPVAFDHELVSGLTLPMVWKLTSNGYPEWQGASGHPHAYARNSQMCSGEADFSGSIIAQLHLLREWWVSTDGSPANAPWMANAQHWWNSRDGADFFAYHGKDAQFITAPDGFNPEALTAPLAPGMIDSFFAAVLTCDSCGARFHERYAQGANAVCDHCNAPMNRMCPSCCEVHDNYECEYEEEDEEEEEEEATNGVPVGITY